VTGRQAEVAGSLAPVSIRISACNTCIIHLVMARVCAGRKIVRSATGSKSIDGVAPARPLEFQKTKSELSGDFCPSLIAAHSLGSGRLTTSHLGEQRCKT
jgi:hypothetical protein